MWFLSRHFQNLNARYHGPEGDAFAIEELNPVASRFLPLHGAALEIGCGYGRNLVGLAQLDARIVVGCDPSGPELARARARVAALPDGVGARVGLIQQEPYHLPFPDSAFDLVVLWQVLEHLFGPTEKQVVLAEAIRVLRPGGHILIETPNQLFPFDYHDNKLPLVHWIGTRSLREWCTYKIRGQRYHPSEYMTLWQCERALRNSPGVSGITKTTRVYFAPSFREAWRALGGSQVALKRLLLAAAAPVHALLSPFGGSADLILPSLRLVYRIDKDERTKLAPAHEAGAIKRGS
jgi:SAM-dependent methyltransferase